MKLLKRISGKSIVSVYLLLFCRLVQQSNIQQLKEDIRESNKMPVSNSGTLRHSHKKNRPAPPPPVQQPPPVADLEIREPAELLVGVPATLTTQWRHQPEALVQGHITYQAQVSIDTVTQWSIQ